MAQENCKQNFILTANLAQKNLEQSKEIRQNWTGPGKLVSSFA